MEKNNQKNLTKFLSFFINRPNHLAKYLIDNDALKREFISKLQKESDYKLLEGKLKMTYFENLDHMNEFFKKLIDSNVKLEDSEKNLIEKLEKELQLSILEERYEDSIRIRDYLKNIFDKKK
jgi:hypothetical protein